MIERVWKLTKKNLLPAYETADGPRLGIDSYV